MNMKIGRRAILKVAMVSACAVPTALRAELRNKKPSDSSGKCFLITSKAAESFVPGLLENRPEHEHLRIDTDVMAFWRSNQPERLASGRIIALTDWSDFLLLSGLLREHLTFAELSPSEAIISAADDTRLQRSHLFYWSVF